MSQNPLLVKTVFCLMIRLSFETLALPHQNFEKLLENIMTISYRGVIRKCESMNCESNNLRIVSYLINNLPVNLSASCKTYQCGHCFNLANVTK